MALLSSAPMKSAHRTTLAALCLLGGLAALTLTEMDRDVRQSWTEDYAAWDQRRLKEIADYKAWMQRRRIEVSKLVATSDPGVRGLSEQLAGVALAEAERDYLKAKPPSDETAPLLKQHLPLSPTEGWVAGMGLLLLGGVFLATGSQPARLVTQN